MTGRGVDQLLPHPLPPRIYEPFAKSAAEYVELAERAHGALPRPVPYEYVWGDALDQLRAERPHVRLINLETSVTTSERAADKGINYRMHPDNVPVLRVAGIDCASLANNHVLDWGVEGLGDTLDTLAGAGIRVAGAGRNLAEAEAPAVIDVATGVRVLVFAFGTADSGIPAIWGAEAGAAGVHLLPDLSEASVALVARLVERTKRRGDVAVASIHWGENWGYDIPPLHRGFAHGLVDHASVDVVHGHSSHHPLAIEVRRGRPIFYGCGDFLNDYEGIPGHGEFRGDLVLMYFVSLDSSSGTLAKLEMVPLQIHRFRLRHVADDDLAWLRDMLGRECERFGHGVTVRGHKLLLET
jgi:poly-gamma-glutamate synthesis protein (capsule biosynthesis protein)